MLILKHCLCQSHHCYSPSGSLSPSQPSAVLLQGPHELVCLAYGFSPAPINITWLLHGTTQLQSYNTSEAHRGPKGKFSIQSRLPLSPSEWLPGDIYTCKVTHSTADKTLNMSKPGLYMSCKLGHLNMHKVHPGVSSRWSYTYTTILLNSHCGCHWCHLMHMFLQKMSCSSKLSLDEMDGDIWHN